MFWSNKLQLNILKPVRAFYYSFIFVVCGLIGLGEKNSPIANTMKQIYLLFSIYSLSVLGISSNLIGSLSRSN